MSDRAHLQLGEELRTVLGELVRKARSRDELPLNHAAALGHLERTGPATIVELAQACQIRHQSMTAIVQQMSLRGEVIPEPHPTDRRAVLYHLTEEGLSDLHRDRQVRASWLADSIESQFGSSTKGVEDAIRVLRQLQVGQRV